MVRKKVSPEIRRQYKYTNEWLAEKKRLERKREREKIYRDEKN